MASAEQDVKIKPGAKKERDRADRTMPSLKIQQILGAIHTRVTTSEKEETPADQKLKPRELIGLANSAAGLSRILRERDREVAQKEKSKDKKALF
jgi:hypothetical protein